MQRTIKIDNYQVIVYGDYPLYRHALVNLLSKLNLKLDIESYKLDSETVKRSCHADILIFFYSQDLIRTIENSVSSVWKKNVKTIIFTPSKGLLPKSPIGLNAPPMILPLAMHIKEIEYYLHSFLELNKLEVCEEIELKNSVQLLFQQDIASLTRRETEVMRLMSEGLGAKEIAKNLSIEKNTVKVFVGKIYRKLGIMNQTQAASLFLSNQFSTL